MKISNFELYWIDFENYKKILYEKKININIYQTPEWLKIISSTKNLDIKFLVVKNKSKVISITPFTKKKFLFLNFFGCPLSGTFSLYNGIILNGSYSEEQLSVLIRVQTEFLKKFTNYTEYIFDERLKDNFQINNVFKKLQFRLYLYNSFLLDLGIDKNILWRNMEGRARNTIRKAKKNNINIRFDEPDRDWMINFYDMLKNTFRKSSRLPPHSLNFYLNLIKLPKDKIRFVSALKDQNILSKAIFLIDDNKIIYFSGTSNQLGYKLSANAYLLWEVISNNNIEKIKYFDFGGAGNQAIDKFKQSFGGKNISYYRWVKCNFFLEKMIMFVKYLSKKGILKTNVV